MPPAGDMLFLPINMTRVSQALSKRECGAGQLLAAVLAWLLFACVCGVLAAEGATLPRASTTITNIEQFWALSATAGEEDIQVQELAPSDPFAVSRRTIASLLQFSTGNNSNRRVQVSGVVVGLDCTPTKPCRTDWSNVRRVVIK